MASKDPEDVKAGDKVIVNKGKSNEETRTATSNAKPGGGMFVDIQTDKGQITAQKGVPIDTED